MNTSARFTQAIEARDFTMLDSLFAPDIRYFGPRDANPAVGRRAAVLSLWASLSRLQQIRYAGQFTGDSAHVLALHFDAVTNLGHRLEGIDILELNQQQQIQTLTVLLRPLDAMPGLSRHQRLAPAQRHPRIDIAARLDR